MSHRISASAFALIAMSLTACAVAFAAPKKKSAHKPVKKPTPRVVLGTKQLSGDQAVLGQVYTLGKESAMNITLNRVEYSTDRLRFGEEAKIPGADEKFLVLYYTLHNPLGHEQLVRFDTFEFTAVDSTDTNRESPRNVGVESTQQELDVNLKPGQKINAYTFIPVPAKATVPKLIIKAREEMVLRYDLRGKVKPLSGPAVDPADKDGASALGEVPAQFGKTYQMGVFDVTINSAEYSTKARPDQELEEGARNFIVSGTVKTAHPREQLLRFDSIQVTYTDQDGADISFSQDLIAASRDASFETNLAFGKEVKVRFPVKVAKDQNVMRMSIGQGESPRTYVYDMSGVK
jgi:hypothetical protein